MAAPVYATDLATLDLAEANTNWAEPTAAGWTLGAAPGTADPENAIQGTNGVPKAFNATGVGGMLANFGSAPTIPTDGVFMGWCFFASPANIDTEANGGLRLVAGSALNNFKAWKLLGSDSYLYGGWVNLAADPTVAADYTETGSGSNQYFGWVVKTLSNITKGSPFVTDAFRYGRAEARISEGSTADGYATFAGFATTNDNSSNRWGLIQNIPGGYLWKGLITLGYSTAVDFRDSNRSIVIDNTKKVGAAFNKIQIRQSTSRVDWTNILITSLSTVSRGRFEVVDNADVNFLACQFTNMDTFILLGATDILNSIFKNCNTITAPGSKLNGTSVLTPIVAADASAVIWNVNTETDGSLDDMIFSKGTNAHHAIEFGSSIPSEITLRGCDFTGFSASQNNNASIFHFKDTGGTITLNLINCSSDVSFATSYRSDGATIVINIDPVTFSVTVKDLDTSAAIENARVIVPVTSGVNFPYLASVSIVSTGTTATVTHTNHGLATNDSILISGVNEDEYNGVFVITVTGVSTYTYVMAGDPADTATGTPVATMVLINGVTNASGIITDARTYSSDQPVSGWARRHTYGPSYTAATWTDGTNTLTKTGAFTGMSGTFLITITAGTNMTPGIYLATWVNANDVTLPGGAGSANSTNVEFTIGAKPLYRQAPVADTVNSVNGLSVTVFLQPDE